MKIAESVQYDRFGQKLESVKSVDGFQNGRGRLDAEDDRRQMSLYEFPAFSAGDRLHPVDAPQQVDESGKRRIGVGVELVRREQHMSGRRRRKYHHNVGYAFNTVTKRRKISLTKLS